ncbi:AMP-binding protein [Myxococcus sp. K15C18031901]|uniref:phenylacetate--CoA ligase family protein n=1 Tax=Myxococcus dinghuensis TaxID=2906761 RepID=UPI0020A74140|nr:AMP-binding protein [Myxococcus dinghuensis]MCP3098102.1 AMP-binding protein [Myxococcus dinghuensis]
MSTELERLGTHLAELLDWRVAVATEVESVLRLDREGLRAWRERALVEAVARARRGSAFYGRRLGEAATALTEHGDVTALTRLPFTTRQDLHDGYPFDFLAVPRRDVARFGESSGTSTGKSIAAYFTSRDWITNNCTVAHFLKQVLTGEDVAAVAVPYELAGVGQDLDRSLELVGCTVVALGALTQFCPPERMVDILRETGVTTLVCSGTRALYLAQVARARGWEPRQDLKVSKVLFAGEGASPAKRQKLHEVWGARSYAMYGMTETNTLGMFCRQDALHLIENRSWFEVVHPETGEPVEGGEVGELVVTSLRSEAMPLVRYRTGDLCRIEDKPCPCGSALRTVRHQGRLADRVLVNQTPISQLQLEDVIMSHLTDAPFYFAFKSSGAELLVGLTASNMTDRVRNAIRADLDGRFRIPASFTLMSEETFEQSIRSAVKPTMKSFLIE